MNPYVNMMPKSEWICLFNPGGWTDRGQVMQPPTSSRQGLKQGFSAEIGKLAVATGLAMSVFVGSGAVSTTVQAPVLSAEVAPRTRDDFDEELSRLRERGVNVDEMIERAVARVASFRATA